jgi:hypothetical protein
LRDPPRENPRTGRAEHFVSADEMARTRAMGQVVEGPRGEFGKVKPGAKGRMGTAMIAAQRAIASAMRDQRLVHFPEDISHPGNEQECRISN